MASDGRLSRRMFLRAASAAAGGSWLASAACDVDSGDHARDASDADAAAGPAATAACRPLLTPSSAFFRQFGGKATVEGWGMPQLDAGTFELRITGLVERELGVTLAQLMAEPAAHVRVVKTMLCVFGLHDTAIWTGVPLQRLLDRAGIDRERARRFRFIGADGFENNLRVADVYESPPAQFEPLIAFAIYDQPLPRELGFPFRLLLADRYGYKNIKWLARIEVSDEDRVTGQYQARGYSDAGLIEPAVWVENQRLTDRVRAGQVELCGFALSGQSSVAAVEVAVDSSGFAPAALRELRELRADEPRLEHVLQLDDETRFGPSPSGVWVAWRFAFTAAIGDHALRIRVRDGAGRVVDAALLRVTAYA